MDNAINTILIVLCMVILFVIQAIGIGIRLDELEQNLSCEVQRND